MNSASKNAKVVRLYVGYVRDAKRLSETTIRAIEKAIHSYEIATEDADFKTFDRQKARRFTAWLEKVGPSGNGASAHQSYQILRQLSAFFHWLASRSGYKSRIVSSDIEYLSLEKIKMQRINSPISVDWPDREFVNELVNSISVENELDRRDKALVCFLFLSGMRDMAIATLPLGCFDSKTLEVRQFPDMGVKTKNSKRFVSKLFTFDENLLLIVTNWVSHLKIKRGFQSTDPIFPRTLVVRHQQTGEFATQDIEPVFWKGAGPIRSILKSRSERAGLKYYKPHSFRHAASQLELRQCMNPEEIRAVSQNLGHENVGTTLTNYAKLTPDRLKYVLGSIDFCNNAEDQFDEQFMRKLTLFARRREKG
ncbi:site-specific integrase [bacterium AH-315-J21]|nr:site-specific integrase [bacterium AH-315-J21]